MNTQFSSKAALSVAIIGGWMVLTAQSCGDSTGPTVVIQECDVTLDSDFPTDGNFYLNKPANCPILLAGMTTIPYAATADFPSWAITYGFYEGSVVTWDGYLVTLVANPVWNQGDGKYFVNITGDYQAATGGFKSDDTGWDEVRNGFRDPSGNWTYANAKLTYAFGFPSNLITAPSLPEAYATYTASAKTNDWRLTGPLTWKWYVNSNLVKSGSASSVDIQAGGPNSQQDIEVVASDSYGNSVSGSKTVHVASGCPDREIYC
jgi:hypothetical protein